MAGLILVQVETAGFETSGVRGKFPRPGHVSHGDRKQGPCDRDVPVRDLPEFRALAESHGAFHELAGQLIALLPQGREAEALDAGTRFIALSQHVIAHLQALQQQIGRK